MSTSPFPCVSGTSPNEFGPLTLSLTDYDFSFAEQLNYFVATARTGTPGPSGYSEFQSFKFCLKEGILITKNEDQGLLNVGPIPTEEPQPPHFSLYEYLSLSGEFYAGTFVGPENSIRIGGLGVIDLMDTDPVYMSMHSMPFYGPGILRDKNGNHFGIQSHGVTLQKVNIQQNTATFDVPRYNIHRTEYIETSMMVMGLIYEKDTPLT